MKISESPFRNKKEVNEDFGFLGFLSNVRISDRPLRNKKKVNEDFLESFQKQGGK